MAAKTKGGEVVLRLTTKQIKNLREQLRASGTRDWVEDPEVLRMLQSRERAVARDIRAGRFSTLEEITRRRSRRSTVHA